MITDAIVSVILPFPFHPAQMMLATGRGFAHEAKLMATSSHDSPHHFLPAHDKLQLC